MPFLKTVRHRIEAAAVRFAAWLVPKLSRQSCVRVANALGEIAWRLDRRGREVALENLRCTLGSALTTEQMHAAGRESYRNFARTMVDLFWSPNLQRPEHRHWVRTINWPTAAERLRPGAPGVMYLTLHYGNWEWANLAAGLLGYRCPAVAETFKNPWLTEVFTSLREISGAVIIPQEGSMIRMLKTVKRGGATAMLADLNVPPSQASTVIRTFGLEMCVSVLHAVLAQRGGARIVPVISRPDADGGCTMTAGSELAIKPDSSLQEIAQLCWDFYEPHIQAHPGLWLWAYKHFRYRPKDASKAFPAYANESKAFEKLRKKELSAEAR